MRGTVRRSVNRIDRALRRGHVAVRGERSSLIVVLFHSLFRTVDEADCGAMAPQQRVLVSQFRDVVAHFERLGHRFVTPDDVVEGLDPARSHVLLTFDDGYANNRLALPVLDEFGVPAVFFVSTRFVREATSFWWDVVFRERTKSGVDLDAVRRELAVLKSASPEQIDRHLADEFAPDAAVPVGDVDRPMTPTELRELAAHPLVSIGNHTVGHTNLAVRSAAEVGADVELAQAEIEDMTGRRPTAIAYPNGDHTRETAEICRSLGLAVGFTTVPGKIGLPLDRADDPVRLMLLERFIVHGRRDIATQCDEIRSDIAPLATLRSLKSSLARTSREPATPSAHAAPATSSSYQDR